MTTPKPPTPPKIGSFSARTQNLNRKDLERKRRAESGTAAAIEINRIRREILPNIVGRELSQLKNEVATYETKVQTALGVLYGLDQTKYNGLANYASKMIELYYEDGARVYYNASTMKLEEAVTRIRPEIDKLKGDLDKDKLFSVPIPDSVIITDEDIQFRDSYKSALKDAKAALQMIVGIAEAKFDSRKQKMDGFISKIKSTVKPYLAGIGTTLAIGAAASSPIFALGYMAYRKVRDTQEAEQVDNDQNPEQEKYEQEQRSYLRKTPEQMLSGNEGFFGQNTQSPESEDPVMSRHEYGGDEEELVESESEIETGGVVRPRNQHIGGASNRLIGILQHHTNLLNAIVHNTSTLVELQQRRMNEYSRGQEEAAFENRTASPVGGYGPDGVPLAGVGFGGSPYAASGTGNAGDIPLIPTGIKNTVWDTVKTFLGRTAGPVIGSVLGSLGLGWMARRGKGAATAIDVARTATPAVVSAGRTSARMVPGIGQVVEPALGGARTAAATAAADTRFATLARVGAETGVLSGLKTFISKAAWPVIAALTAWDIYDRVKNRKEAPGSAVKNVGLSAIGIDSNTKFTEGLSVATHIAPATLEDSLKKEKAIEAYFKPWADNIKALYDKITWGNKSTTAPTATRSKTPDTLPFDFAAYASSLAGAESSNDYGADNQLGYIGKYQMGRMSLEDAGLIKAGTSKAAKARKEAESVTVSNPENWTIKGGADAFKKNAELQEKTFREYTERNIKVLQAQGTILEQDTAETIAGYLAAAHLVGPGHITRSDLTSTDKKGTTAQHHYDVGWSSQVKKQVQAFPTGGETQQPVRQELAQTVNANPREDAMSKLLTKGFSAISSSQTNIITGGGGPQRSDMKLESPCDPNGLIQCLTLGLSPVASR